MKAKIAAIILCVIALTGCAPYDVMEDTGKAEPIADYRTSMGWYEGNLITTIDGHIWEVSNPNGYVGYVEVFFDGNETADITDDKIVLITEIDK